MKSASSRRKRDGGFTLIEVLISVSITAVVLTLLYGSFFQLMESRDRVEARNEAGGEADAVLSRIRHDLSNAFARGRVSSLASSSYPHDYFVGRMKDGNSSISFTSFPSDPFHRSARSGQSEISYYAVPVREEPRRLFALVRKDNYRIGNDGAGTVYPVSERVLGFRANFHTRSSLSFPGAEKVREWNSSVTESFPRAVEIEIDFELGDGGAETRSTLVSIPVAE